MKPEDGTLCGNKKWCYDGRCRYSSWAPEINDCSLGDISTNCKKDQCPVYSVTQRMNCCQTCPQALKENMTDLTENLKTTSIYIPTSTKKTETARTTTRLSPVSFTATSDPGVTQAATSLSSEPRSTTSRPVSKTLSSATKNSPRTLTTTSSDGSTIQRRENGGGSGSKADQNVGLITGTSIAAVLIVGTAILVTVVCVVRHRFSKSRTVSLSNQPANAIRSVWKGENSCFMTPQHILNYEQ
ncbi:uncharacterized protein LOC121383337 isoform X2 [Gigantopelta aegis]|uniref:uncharacterized protein LOC121383337 isoform X2 n=1 Tax=Gigantopelta aegis TaxID=1735272 RepID=UPI001B887A28|nr:uncharacterized protein LOC121383337 isoform X2 [Gigantopelta aegis]